MRFTRPLLLVLVVVLQGATLTTAQVNWMSPLHEPGVSLEITKTNFSGGTDFAFLTNQFSLSARIALGRNLFGLVEVPYMHIGFKERWYDGSSNLLVRNFSQSTFGNPYFGIEFGGRGTGPRLRMGGRVPLTDGDDIYATNFGQYATFDREETFVPDLYSLQAAFGYIKTGPSEYRASIFVGPLIMLPRYDGEDTEVMAEFAAELWGEGRLVQAGIGYHLRYLCTESSWSFNRCMEHQFGVTTVATIGAVHPGLHFRFPLDKGINYGIEMTYGFNLTVDLPASD